MHENTADFLLETTKTKKAEGPTEDHEDQSLMRVNLSTADHTQAKKRTSHLWVCDVQSVHLL